MTTNRPSGKATASGRLDLGIRVTGHAFKFHLSTVRSVKLRAESVDSSNVISDGCFSRQLDTKCKACLLGL